MRFSTRCLDKLVEHKDELFKFLKRRWGELFDASFEVLLYDLIPEFEHRLQRHFSRGGRLSVAWPGAALVGGQREPVALTKGVPLLQSCQDPQPSPGEIRSRCEQHCGPWSFWVRPAAAKCGTRACRVYTLATEVTALPRDCGDRR